MGSAQRPLALTSLYVALDLVAVTPYPERRRIKQHSHPVFAQDRGDRLCDVGVFTFKELAAALRDRHAAAQAPEQLAELQPDVAAADNEQMLRHRIQLHDRGRVQVWYGV